MSAVFRHIALAAIALMCISCDPESRLPSPSQQAVGLYKGELAILDEFSGDTLESQGGITLRVDPMEPGVVKFSLIRVRFANIEVGDVHLNANIERFNETYLVLSAYNVPVSVPIENMELEVDINGWQEGDDLHLFMHTSMYINDFSQPMDVIVTYAGNRGR